MAEVNVEFRRTFVDLTADDGMTDEYIVGDGVRSMSITVHPGQGGTAQILVSCRSKEDVDAGNADWTPVDFAGVVDLDEDSGSELPVSILGVRLAASGATASARLALVI